MEDLVGLHIVMVLEQKQELVTSCHPRTTFEIALLRIGTKFTQWHFAAG